MIAVLLLAGLAYLLSGCSNEVLIGEKGGKDDSDDGKVMLAMTVRATPLSVSGDTDAGSEEERAIRSLYVFVFNIGASQYCEAERFSVYDMAEAGGKYTFKMEVTPGYKRFYLVANPGIDLRTNLASYTQAELQDLRTMVLNDHQDGYSYQHLEDGLKSDQIMTALKDGKGIPMSMSVTGRISLNKTKAGSEGIAQGNLVLDDGSDIFSLIRAVAKVRLICRVKNELPSHNFELEEFNILQANRQTYLFPKYTVADDKWGVDFPSMTEAADLTRTVGYVYGKQENHSGQEWLEFDRGTHYLYENYFGPTLPDDTQEGLIDETKYSWIHVILDDGRDRTFALPYLKRNDYLTVRINMSASDIICDIQPWEKEDIYPDYTDTTN
ncbi:hypothetical protein ACM15_17285 [Parabacteroides goldsteinii]|uniref:Major fimbrial subunit protein N-terminal domain-containing protein n=2 Tax=Parabacteroides goldsteinii TaxID=328812 RepID=A0A0J6C7Z8_9BACT|nr:hypothetical protein ACM15_17285 [Parabacteroides goldsteinii]